MAALRASAVAGLLIAASLALPLGAPAEAALSASDILGLPRWAVGFNWTYAYAGATNQEIGAFRATYMTDTYTSQVVGESSTPRGDAWVVANNHAGTLTGTAYGFPASGDFTSLNFYYVRKSDLAVLNSSQDLQVSARAPPFPPVQGSSYNATYADPPLAQIAFGAPADGTPWRVASNLTSTGWYKIGSSPQVNTFSYLALDYNLSVTAIETALVPAGSLPAYNITGGGTADNNGTTYAFTEGFLFAPDALNKAKDEGGYRLLAYSINRAPVALALPPLDVPSASSASLNLSAYFSDPDGDPFTVSCTPASPLDCSVAPNGTLTVTDIAGGNGTYFLTLTADDGKPAGNATFTLTVLVTIVTNPNLPPEWMGPPEFELSEDADSTFQLADLIFDPDDTNHTYSITPESPLIVLASNATSFTLHTPPNFFGFTNLSITVFDGSGNFLTRRIAVTVDPANDPPTLTALTELDLFVHTYGNVTAAVLGEDIEGQPLTYGWFLDGAPAPGFATRRDYAYFSQGEDSGTHALRAEVTDLSGGFASLTFTIHVFRGPELVSYFPTSPTLHVANGTTLAFEINASDPDTPTLNYTWSSGSTVFGSGPNATSFSLLVAQSAPFDVLGLAADNGSSAGFLWRITVEEVPAGLVRVLAPAEGSSFPANSTVEVSALVDTRLSNLSVRWSLDGAFLSLAEDARTPALEGPSNHTLTLEVEGLYNATIPYSARLTVNFTVLAPTPPNNTGGGGNGGAAPLGGGDLLLPLILAASLAGAALALALRRRRTRAPPR